MAGSDTSQRSTVDRQQGLGAPRARTHRDEDVLPLPIRQRLWDQLWQRLLAPVPASGQGNADGEGR